MKCCLAVESQVHAAECRWSRYLDFLLQCLFAELWIHAAEDGQSHYPSSLLTGMSWSPVTRMKRTEAVFDEPLCDPRDRVIRPTLSLTGPGQLEMLFGHPHQSLRDVTCSS